MRPDSLRSATPMKIGYILVSKVVIAFSSPESLEKWEGCFDDTTGNG
jgi:hypothetical protein